MRDSDFDGLLPAAKLRLAQEKMKNLITVGNEFTPEQRKTLFMMWSDAFCEYCGKDYLSSGRCYCTADE